MATTLNDTPSANRIHIGFFGRRNSGKSSLMNAFCGQDVAIVSNVAGTTTDPVSKAMEIAGMGACVLVDTAGFDDEGNLGLDRVDKTRKTADKIDIAVIVFDSLDVEVERKWYDYFSKRQTQIVGVISKADIKKNDDIELLKAEIIKQFGLSPVVVSSNTMLGINELKEVLLRAIPEDFASKSILGELVAEGDGVVLVMPQDIQAPKGRLILPQVQVIRELLDKRCIVTSCTTDKFIETIDSLKSAPKLIIVDSQVFDMIYDKKPEESMLTSFSVLFAGYKGDIEYYVKSAEAINRLTDKSKILIAECCTHVPLGEDIGRVQIPRMLKRKYGEALDITVVSGTDFPKDLSGYDLIIQCGACMFNRKYVLSRITRAKEAKVPMTNYGVAIAYIKGILDKVVYPK